MKNLEREIVSDVQFQSDRLTDALHRMNAIEAVLLFLIPLIILVTIFGAVLVVYRLVIRPVRHLVSTMRLISDGNTLVSVPETDTHNELGEMARAIETFRSVTEHRDQAEVRLEHINVELNNQLLEMQDLRERSDDQAAKALTLAENLALARDEAEAATSRAEAEEKRTRAIFDTIRDAIVSINADSKIEDFNPGAQQMFGYTFDEALGRDVGILMPEDIRENHHRYVERYGEGHPGRIAGSVVEQTAQRKNGEQFPVEIVLSPMYVGGELKFISVIRDITERRKNEQEIRRLALTDSLTGLANRTAFMRSFDDLAHASERHDELLALVLVDLDHFKPVNDTYGHAVGDGVLERVAAILRTNTRKSDAVARLGGDEFAILLSGVKDPKAVEKPVIQIIEQIRLPLSIGEHKVRIGASIGVAFQPRDAENYEDLFSMADKALYQAKEAGRNTFCIYSDD